MAQGIFSPDVRFEPWWWEEAPRPPASETPLPKKIDVAVVGAGYTGLSAALTLARAGRSVLVCEAGVAGAGASSRNGGMIGSSHRLDLADLTARYGRDKAVAILREGIDSLEFTADLIGREGIACHFTRCGRFRAAWRPRDYEALGRESDLLRRAVGLESAMVPARESRKEVDTEFYHGGCVYPRHGSLHPGLFHQGLLDRARAAGALVVDHCPVTAIDRDGGSFTLGSVRGRVAARDVLVATNGYTGPVTPGLGRCLISTMSYMIATEPLPSGTVSALIPGGRTIVETRSRHCYYRASPDGRRILYGARAALRAIDVDAAARRIRRLLVQLFPRLSEVKISHSWRGHIAFPRDKMPHLGQYEGLYFATGYCGSGVAMAPYLGHKIALKMLGLADGACAFDGTSFSTIPFLGGRPWVLPVLDLYYRALDRIEGSA